MPLFPNNIYDALEALTSIVWFAVPGWALWQSSTRAMSFNKENHGQFIEVVDFYDKATFKQLVIPLYQAITDTLFVDTYQGIKNNGARDKELFLKGYEAEKQRLLAQRDFTYLESSIDFQDAQDKILDSRRNKFQLVRVFKRTRIVLISIVIFTSMQLLAGAVIFATKQIWKNDAVASGALGVWLILLVITVIAAISYAYYKIKLDGYKNDQTI